MHLERVAILRGHRPIFSGCDFVLTAKKQFIYKYSIVSGEIEKICSLPNTLFEFIIRNNRLTRRIFRYGVKCGSRISDEEFIVSNSYGIYRINIETGNVTLEKKLVGEFRPLTFTSIFGIIGFQDGIYYGDYGSNPSRGPMNIHFREPDGKWKPVFQFKDQVIDHIHSIIPDPARNSLWILTGDLENAAAIWMAEGGFQNIKPIFQGEQIARSCIAFPTESGLIYATDSHIEPNSIRLLKYNNKTWNSSSITEISGSCIYGTRIGKDYFFSTTHEPGNSTGYLLLDLFDPRRGAGILGDYCEIITGNLEKGFTVLMQRPVDFLPKRLFQFSTFIFPAASDDTNLLVTHSVGLKYWDEVTEVYRLI